MRDSNSEISIDELVDEFSERLERGECPSIEEYLENYPQFAKRIATIFPALVMLENVESQPPTRKLAMDDSVPQVLGEYEIIQEVGRGGMGVVFEARHTTMRRRVALKILPKSAASKSGYVSRFLTEARSAGQLHHTNIVPVFEVGEADGIRYYAMQFIDGDNLDRIIEDVKRLRNRSNDIPSNRVPVSLDRRSQLDLSETIAWNLTDGACDASKRESPQREDESDLGKKSDAAKSVKTTVASGAELGDTRSGDTRSSKVRSRNVYHQRVASIGVQVAEALDHAHNHGVLHRDVKPANLILDTDGIVWVTDFGLAKIETDDLTQTGDIIGTLKYMAPERFSGKADRRSDIYSLGLTLYELCTLQGAFETSHARLVKDLANRSVLPPRKIDDAIPADLETIILKSIEPLPERRYQTAQELADDLSLFLKDRPIKARRAGPTERLWRVCRRNPLASAMAACIVTLLVALAFGSFQFAIFSARKTAHEVMVRQESQKNLYFAKVDQAQMRRYSQRIGQRYESLAAIGQAIKLLPQIDFSRGEREAARVLLRNEAIAALALTDLRNIWSRPVEPQWGQRLRIAFDGNYQLCAEGHNDGRIRITNVRNSNAGNSGNQEPLAMLPSPGLPIGVIQMSRDGRYLAAVHHEENALYQDVLLNVWDLRHPERPLFSTRGVTAFDFSGDNQSLVFAAADHIDVVALKTAEVTGTAKPGFAPRLVEISYSGTEVVVTQRGGNRIERWNMEGEPVRTWSTSVGKDNITAVDWRSEKSVLAVGTTAGGVYFWKGSDFGSPEFLAVHQNEVKRLHLHPTLDLVATDTLESDVHLTHLYSNRTPLRGDHIASLLQTGFSHDGKLCHCSIRGNLVGIWEIARPLLTCFSEFSEVGGSVKFHPTNSHLVARTAGTLIELWDLKHQKRIDFFDAPGHFDFCFSRDGERLLTSGKNGVEKWPIRIRNSDADEPVCSHESPTTLITGPTRAITLDRSGTLIVVADSNFSASLYDSQDGSLKTRFGRHPGLSTIQVTADNRYLLTGTWLGKGVGVWGMESGELVEMLLEDEQNITPWAHPTDGGRFISTGIKIRFWRTGDWEDPGVKNNVELFRSQCRFSRNGDLIAVQNKTYELKLLDPESGQDIAVIETALAKRMVDFSFSSDGNYLAVSCLDDLQILEIRSLRKALAAIELDW